VNPGSLISMKSVQKSRASKLIQPQCCHFGFLSASSGKRDDISKKALARDVTDGRRHVGRIFFALRGTF
jgi:hypothetical protein